MKKDIELIGIISLLCMILLAMSVKGVHAETADAEMQVDVHATGNVNASFDADAGGDVNYWIDGIEVKGEFVNLWDALSTLDSDIYTVINSLNTKINENNGLAADAFNYADQAFSYASDNDVKINNNNKSINDLLLKTLIILDELVRFEENYTVFKEETHLNFTDVKDTLNDHETRITDLELRVSDLESDVDDLQAAMDSLGLIGKAAAGVGLVACGLFLANRRYPFKDIVKNGNSVLGHSHKPSKSTKVKSKAKRASKIPKISVNPDKSPIKIMKKLVKS